jgi:hypothetical protein
VPAIPEEAVEKNSLAVLTGGESWLKIEGRKESSFSAEDREVRQVALGKGWQGWPVTAAEPEKGAELFPWE